MRLGAASALALLLGASGAAYAYDADLRVTTVAQGYQLRRYTSSGEDELIARRRLTQGLSLVLTGLEPWGGVEGDRNRVRAELELRLDTDFASFATGRPAGADTIRELDPLGSLQVLWAFVAAEALGGVIDLTVGRQVRFDRLDFFAFDGGRVVARGPFALSAEALGGVEVTGERPLASPIFQSDGTTPGDRDPRTRPAQHEATRPLVGAGLRWGTPGETPASARLSYRRVWSTTASPELGAPSSGTHREHVGAELDAGRPDAAGWGGFLWAGARFNVLLGAVDEQQLTLRYGLGPRRFVDLETAYLMPSFDGDSIWNVFAPGAYRDVRGGGELGFGEGGAVYARLFLRRFGSSFWGGGGEAAATGVGGVLGARVRGLRGVVRSDLYAQAGEGGRKLGADLAARRALRDDVSVDGRVTVYGVDGRGGGPGARGTVVAGAQGGGRWRPADGVALHGLVEVNTGTWFRGELRGLLVLDLGVKL